MSLAPSERKSWGPLIATIDLLFLVVAFFTLMLFFVQKERTQTQVRLNQVEESLAAALPPSSESKEERGNALVTLVDRLMTAQKQEHAKEVQAQEREQRRNTRPIVRISYQVLPGGHILSGTHTYTPTEFMTEVIEPARRSSWLAIRAYANPETPFGDVVALRKLMLDNGGEFDTYWDNLADSATGAGPGSGARLRSR